MRDPSHFWIVLLALAIACEPQPEEATPERRGLRADVLGCYELRERNGGPLDTAKSFAASARFRLAAEPIDSTHGSPWLRYEWSVTRGSPPLGYDAVSRSSHDDGLGWTTWTADSLSDTVRVRFSNGFSGTLVRFAYPMDVRGTSIGWLEQQFDAPPYGDGKRPVRVARTPCPSLGS